MRKAEFRRADRDFQVGDILVYANYAIPPREFRHFLHYGEYTEILLERLLISP